MVRWTSGRRPERTGPSQPVIVAAFEGWNDAGEAATDAIRHLEAMWGAVPLADIDPEEFFDFTAVRPHVRLTADGRREVIWPATEFRSATPDGSPAVVLARGVEPQLRWRTFCAQVLDVAAATNARLIITLGALLADAAHTRPTPVFGTAYDPKVLEALDLEPSRYEGPTGVVGVLHAECIARGVNSASLWAAVPSYVPAVASPKAVHALVDRVCAILGTPAPVGDLEERAAEYERQISDLVVEDEDTVAYVAQLEEAHDRDALAGESADSLVSEVERFLRGQ